MPDNFKKIFIFISTLPAFTSCTAINGIFKAGMGVGVFAVIAILVVIVFIVTRFTRNK